MRYSTALSGLLKLALMAFTTRSRSKPISMMFCTALSYSGPDNKLDAPKPAEAAVGLDAAAVVVVVAEGLAAGADVAAGLVVVAEAAAALDADVAVVEEEEEEAVGFEADELVVG